MANKADPRLQRAALAPLVALALLSSPIARAVRAPDGAIQGGIEDLGLCANAEGAFSNIRRLVCQTDPALLRAMNPALQIPRCDERQTGPRIVSGLSPVSAVFVSCTATTFDSCIRMIDSMAAARTGATINVLVSQRVLATRGSELGRAFYRASQRGTPVNALPIDGSTTKYLRDPGIFRSEGEAVDYAALPYSNDGAHRLGEQIAAACGGSLRFSPSYRSLATFDGVYAPHASQGDGAGATAEIAGDADKTANFGGNFLALPNGSVAVGRPLNRPDRAPNQAVLEFFRRTQAVAEITLPALSVGHIDEIFNAVPADNACGFEVLRASPALMRQLLSAPASRADPGAARTLGNRELQARWDEWDRTIKTTSSAQLLAALAPGLPAGCQPRFVDVPVHWGRTGAPGLPNPVNGLNVNGNYFYSDATNDSLTGLEFSEATLSSIRQETRRILASATRSRLHAVETAEFNRSEGNFHCATTNIMLPCSNR